MTLGTFRRRHRQRPVKVRSFTSLVGAELTAERVFKRRLAEARVWTVEQLTRILERGQKERDPLQRERRELRRIIGYCDNKHCRVAIRAFDSPVQCWKCGEILL